MSVRALLFSLSGARLAVPATASREVFVPGALTPLPAAGALLGLTSVRGRAVPLIDLSALLELPAAPTDQALLLEVDGERLAVPVQTVQGFADLTPPSADGALTSDTLLDGTPVRLLQLPVLTQAIRARLAFQAS